MVIGTIGYNLQNKQNVYHVNCLYLLSHPHFSLLNPKMLNIWVLKSQSIRIDLNSFWVFVT